MKKENLPKDINEALRWASSNGHLEVVKLLLEHGASVHAKDNLALQWAIDRGHLEVAELLNKYI